MAYVQPTVADFKSRFDRDFAFCSADDQTDTTRVRDVDVTRAINSATVNFNVALWASQETYSEAFLLLVAHYLCTNLLNSSQGLGSAAQWLTNSKMAGGLTESFAIPERISRSPILSVYSKTGYGMEYLSLLLPMLTGNVVGICGNTTP